MSDPINSWNPLTRIEAKLDRLTTLVHILTRKVNDMSVELDTRIAKLQDDVTALTGVVASANALIGGFAKLLADAIAAAQAAGATPQELQSLTDLSTSLEAQKDSLAAAVVAGTPPTP